MRLLPTSRATAAGLLGVAIALTSVAHDVEAQPKRRGAAAESAEQRAMALFDKSDTAYREGRFQEAIDLLNEAYALDPKPVLLYNLARAYEGLGDIPKAIEGYRRYLDNDPKAPDRGALEQRIATLERQQREREALEKERDAAASKKEEPSPARPPPAAPPVAGDNDAPSPLPWVIAGVGVAGVGVGIGLGLVAKGRHDDALAEPEGKKSVEIQDGAETVALGASIALIAGGVLAAAGTVWGIVDIAGSGSSPSSPRVSGAIGLGSVALRGRF